MLKESDQKIGYLVQNISTEIQCSSIDLLHISRKAKRTVQFELKHIIEKIDSLNQELWDFGQRLKQTGEHGPEIKKTIKNQTT